MQLTRLDALVEQLNALRWDARSQEALPRVRTDMELSRNCEKAQRFRHLR